MIKNVMSNLQFWISVITMFFSLITCLISLKKLKNKKHNRNTIFVAIISFVVLVVALLWIFICLDDSDKSEFSLPVVDFSVNFGMNRVDLVNDLIIRGYTPDNHDNEEPYFSYISTENEWCGSNGSLSFYFDKDDKLEAVSWVMIIGEENFVSFLETKKGILEYLNYCFGNSSVIHEGHSYFWTGKEKYDVRVELSDDYFGVYWYPKDKNLDESDYETIMIDTRGDIVVVYPQCISIYAKNEFDEYIPVSYEQIELAEGEFYIITEHSEYCLEYKNGCYYCENVDSKSFEIELRGNTEYEIVNNTFRNDDGLSYEITLDMSLKNINKYEEFWESYESCIEKAYYFKDENGELIKNQHFYFDEKGTIYLKIAWDIFENAPCIYFEDGNLTPVMISREYNTRQWIN